MTSFVLYILVTVISVQYVSSVPPDPATAPAVDQQADPSVITPIDTVTVPGEQQVSPPAVQETAPVVSAIPVCDGSQVIYATPPSQDTITGMPNGPGLDAITLSNDGINTFLSNKIGIASNMGQLVPDQQPEAEIIRSGSIDPLTGNLVLLYQEINPMDPTMSEPNQRLIIIPVFKLNSLLIESPALTQTGAAGVVGGAEAVAPGLEAQLSQAQRPGILAYELEQEIDLSEVEVGDQIPLTEIAFDCAGNLLGITLEGELVQMIIEAGNSNLEMDYIGRVQFQGPVIELSQGFVGLTYDFQTNAFVAVGGLMGKTLVQFQVAECTVFQIGNPIIITDNDNLCPQGIVSIAARGDNQYYVTCVDTAVGPMAMGLAVLELQGNTATILPLNAAQGQTLVPLPNSSGGAIIPSIPSTTGNSICFPRSIQSTPPTCNVLPADTDCQGDIQMQQVFPPPMAAPGASVNGGTGTGLVPPPGAQISVGAAPVNGQVGGYGLEAGGQGQAQGFNSPLGTSFNGNIVPGTDTANAQANGFNSPLGTNGFATGAEAAAAEGFGSGSASGSGSSSSGSSASSASGSSGSSGSGSSSASGSGSDDDSSSGSGSDDSSDDDSDDSDDSSGSDDSVSGSGSDDDSDNSGSDDSSDDNSDDSDDSSGTGSGSDDNNSGSDDDDDEDEESDDNGGSADDNSLDDDGDESDDDDNNASQSSESSEERESGDDALSNGNDFNKNGFVSAQEYGSNGNGQMISLSPSTLANLWGLAMIFLAINVTFLFVCYRNGNCKKNQVTMDDDMDADIESL